MKKIKLFKALMLLFSIMLISPQMWAYWHVPGTHAADGWDASDGKESQMNSSNYVTFYALAAGTYEFKLVKGSEWGHGGTFTNNSSSIITDLCKDCSNGNNKFTINCIADVTFHITNETNWDCEVSAVESSYFIKYPWNGGSYSWSGAMVSNLDGTYSVYGLYGGKSYNYGRRGYDGGAGTGYKENGATITGSTPSTGNKCIFTLDPSNSNALDIRKCNTVTKNNYIYFDNTNANWTQTYMYFVIGRPEYSKMYRIAQISNTNMWYVANTSDNWTDCGYYAIAGGGTAWDGGTGWGPASLSGWTKYSAPYLSQYNLVSNKTYLVSKANNSNGGAITLTQYDSYSDFNFCSQTIQYALSIDGGSSYSDMSSGKTPGQISINTWYQYSGAGSVTSKSAQTASADATTYSKTASNAGYRTKVVLKESSTQTGYEFVGWFDGNTKLSEGDYTYYPTEAKTIKARFKAKQYTLTLNANGGGSGSSSAKATWLQASISTITNPTKAGSVFIGWFSGLGATGTMVVDKNGKLQPNSAYTDANGQWTNNGNVTLYAGWLTVHSPGDYKDTYGKDPTMYNCEQYELYGASKTNSSAAYRILAGEKVNNSTDYSSASNKVITFNTSTLVRSGWIEGNHQGNSSTTIPNTGEFSPFPTSSSIGLTMKDGQYIQFCVTGYSKLNLIAADNTVDSKNFRVEIDGEDVTDNQSTSATIRPYTLTPASTQIVKITALGSSTSTFFGFSLKVHDDYPDPTAFSCTSVTSSSATLSITDAENTNDYEFYYSTSSGAPSSGTSATTTSSSKTPTITGLTAETKYYIWVRSKCSSTRKSDWVALSGDYFTTNAASTTYAVSAVTSTGDNSKGSVSAALTELAATETTTVTATPATGYWVTGWAVSGTGASIDDDGSTHSNTTTLTMGTEDATVTVTFGLKDYTVDYNTPSNGNYTTKVASGSATSADKTAQMSQTVALVATPSSGYAFASWTITDTDTDTDITSTLLTGSKSTTASTSFTMPAANISIVATFAKTYTIEKGTYTNGNFTIATSSAVSGATITLTATANTGYVFDHWVVKKKSDSSDVTGSVSISNAKVSPATFTMPSYDVTVDAVFKATPNIYYYKDAGHYNGSTYKNPAKGTASGSDDVTLTTPWKFCDACVTGVDSVVATTGTYDNKGNWMNAYLKVPKGGNATSKNIIFGISAGYTAVISIKIGGYKNNPSVTLKEYSGGSLGSDITKTTGYATVGGVATTENNFNEIRWSSLEAGVYVLNVSGENAYISEIDIQTTPKNYTITLNNQSATTGGTANIAVTFDATTNLTGTPAITVPTKTGYTFGGYYTATDGGGTQIIAANGNVNASASDASYTYTSSTKQWKYAGNITLYAKWTANQYTITLEDYDPDTWGVYFLGDCEGPVDHFPVTYGNNSLDCTLDGESQPMKLPYDFNGWYSGEGGSGDQIVSAFGVFTTGSTAYTDGTGHWNYAGNPTIYAKWTLTLSGYSEIEAETGALYSAGTITFTYKSASTSAFTAATRTGYILDGYYTAADGDKVVNADGTLVADVDGWTDEDGKWIYSTSSSPTLYTKWTPITYTVAFDKDNISKYVYDAEGSMDPVAATYDEYVTMPANTFTREGYSFRGWSKSSDGTLFCLDEATSVKNLTSTQGATVTLYALWTGNTVTVSFNPREGRLLSCRSVELHVGDTYGSAVCTSSDLPEPEAPAGYVFTGWYTSSVGGTQVTKTDKVTTTSDHTLYARYVKQERVYFLNTLGWDSVFVTFDAYWDTYHTPSWGTGNSGREYRKMIKSSGNIYYYDVPVGSLNPWDHYIAFNNKRLGTVGSSSNKDNFDSGEAVFRMDFDTLATMFVPTNNKGATADGNYQLHEVQYRSTGYTEGTSSDPQYTSGYWRVFNDVVSGYVLTYQENGEHPWIPGKSLNAEKAGDSVFVYTATLEANKQYNYNIIKTTKHNGKSDDFKYNDQINSGNCTNLKLQCLPGNGYMQTTVAGDYKFILTMKSDGHMYLSVEYPFAVNDYRVVYSYTKGGSQTFSSEYIKAKAGAVDTISMFIHSGDSATSRSLYIQKCTAINGSGVPTWNTTYRAITLPSETASGKSSGVYNFVITQDGSAAATGECIGRYEGNYYIRCDAADGGWDHYKERADNQMTFSEYSMSQTLSAPFSHYFCKYVGSSSTDITYTVATDYSPMICPILVGDATIGGVGNKTLPSGNPASIRFTWNDETNGTFRSYLKSAQGDGNARFLVLHGSDNKVLDADGNTIAAAGAGAEDMKANELLFSDTENWVYELRFKAKPGAKVSIIARYNGSDRYLVGSSTSWETIISGGADTKYDIAAVYDFKTNRLITTWVPSGTISETIEQVDVLIERHNQDGATTITFGKASVDAEAGSITAKRIIGALRFDYSEMVGRVANWTPDTRAKMMFFISFPFDVNVSDIFGLNSTYGEAFIIQRYNGARRAEEGFFLGDGVETFWDVMPVDSVMHAHEGYVVTLDNDYFNGDVGHIWDNKRSGDHVYMYFPSANDPSEPITINSDPQTIKVPAHRCTIDRAFGKLNHKYTDSNWNLIGVPIFQNHTGNATSGTPGAIFTKTSSPTDSTEYADPDAPTFGYFFEWNTSKNYTIRSAVGYTFKPLHSYMVQYTGNVTFTCAEPVVPSIAARRTPMTANYNIELQVLNSDEEMINHTYVELRENAIDTFALNEDTYMITNSHAVNVYTFAGAYDVAANVLSIGNHVIPVGVKVNREGTYTFTSPSNFSGTVTLVDTYTGARTNLALSDYEVNLTQGTDEERFLLEINVNNTPTAIDGVGDGNGNLKDGKAHKFIMNDQMYILQNGIIYDARGARVK